MNSNGGSIGCAGTGQDGDTKAGIPRRFVNNHDGTITDAATELVWEVKCSGSACGALHDKDTQYGWMQAFSDHIGRLNAARFAGHNDWRLPNFFELLTLWNLDKHWGSGRPATFDAFDNACTSSCNLQQCSCTTTGGNWSSTTVPGSSCQLVLNFQDNIVNNACGGTSAVRAVRGGLRRNN
jgi:hypothetical protein